jgi:hypothetical protein
MSAGILPCEEDVATALAGWGLLPGSLNGKLAVWEADETANLAAWPSEFAEVAAEAACDPAGGAKDAAPLQQAAAAAANAAGLVPQVRTGCWQLVLVRDGGIWSLACCMVPVVRHHVAQPHPSNVNGAPRDMCLPSKPVSRHLCCSSSNKTFALR